METSSRVFANTIYLFVSSGLSLCIAMGANVLFARTLGVELFGEFSFAISFITIFSVLVEFSLDPVIVRDVARHPQMAGAYFGNAFALKCALFLLAIVLIPALARGLGYSPSIRLLLYILGLGLLFEGVKRCSFSIFEARQQMKAPAVLTILERVLFACLGISAMLFNRGVLALVLAYLASQIIVSVVSVVMVVPHCAVEWWSVKYEFCKTLAKSASSFFAISIIAALYADIDKLFLFSMKDAASVGLYAAAYKLIAIPMRFSNAFHRAIYPVLSENAISRDLHLLSETYGRSMRYLMLAAIPTGIGMTVFADPIMRGIYGDSYSAGTTAFQILVWAYVLEFFNPFLSRVLFAVGRQQTVLLAAVVGAVVNIGLNILLIPAYSILGAAFATLISAILIFGILFWTAFSFFPKVSVNSLMLKPIVAGVSMWAVCTSFGSIAAVPAAVFGSLAYCVSLVLIKAVSTKELEVLGYILRGGAWSRGKR